MMNEEMEPWKLEITGLILGWGKYEEAVKIAAEHGDDGILFAMQAAYKDGFTSAIREVVSAAYNAKHAPL